MRVPPPPIQLPDADLFLRMLHELESEVASSARLLIYTLADVRKWLKARQRGEKPDLDAVTREPAREIAALSFELRALLRLLREEPPETETAEAIAFCCYRIATWAEDQGAMITALAFVQTSHAVYPLNPHFAYDVGRLARKLADHTASEEWLRWACRESRRGRAWKVFFLSFAGLGNLARRRGNYPLALRYHLLSLRVARRYDLRTLEGDALYDLAIMHFEMGHVILGHDYARKALEAYGPGHARIPTLAHDVALFWMETVGNFGHARDIFQDLLAHVWEPPARLLILASLTRAAAGAGDESLFEASWNETWALMRRQETREGHAAVLIQVAHGAASFGYWPRVEIAASEALSVARERGEGMHIVLAERMLNQTKADVLREEETSGVFPDYFRRQEEDEDAADLAVKFVNAMRVRQDGAPESPSRTLITGRS